jgi:hypothetical protein
MDKLNLPKIKLNVSEKLWLQYLYAKTLKNEIVTYKEIRTALYKELAPDFHPKQINRLLVDQNGERITLLGILAINSDSDLIHKTNKVINCIRDVLINDFNKQTITSQEISIKIDVKQNEVELILSLLSTYGRFCQGASLREKNIGYTSIDVNSVEVFDQYLYFNSIEELISNYYLKEKEISKNKQSDKSKIANQLDKLNSTSEINYKPIFNSRVSHVDLKLGFVLMPFAKGWSDRVYIRLLRQTIESLGLQCIRTDNLTGTIVIEDIWTKINQAAFIVADVTDLNPNVMYEMGIVHSIGKPAILITQDLKKIPFDFKHLRHYDYSDNEEGFEVFRKRLKGVIIELYKTNYPDIILKTQ